MLNWIKSNLVLVAGILLPVLLVAGFLVLQSIPRALTDAPQYDFLVVAFKYDAQQQRNYDLSFEVRDGRLQGRATPRTDNNNYSSRQLATLYRYRTADNRFDEVPFDLPDTLDSLDSVSTFPIEEVADLKLDKSSRSPDDFIFEYVGYRSRGGLLGEIFGMGRRSNSQYVLSQGAAWFDLPLPTASMQYYGNDLVFLGWVMPATTAP